MIKLPAKKTVVKEFLTTYQRLLRTINLETDKVAKLRSLTEKVTQHLSFTRGGKNEGFVKQVDEIVEFENRISERMTELERVRNEIENAISKIGNPLQEEILQRKYIIGESIEEIADKQGYSVQYIRNEHAKALQAIDKIINA